MTMALIAVSQNSPCYHDQVIDALEQSPFDHGYLLEEADDIIEENIQVTSPQYAAISSNNTYVIPVVVHVLHNSNELENVGSNISDSQIQGAILKLNNDFQNTLGEGVDIDIEFCLAERDPFGNSTNGIRRIDASTCNCDYSTKGMVGLLENNSNEIELKGLSNWPNTEYINIWTVSEINDNNGGLGIQGFATPPGAPDIIDGLVVLASSFTSNNSVATHEMGHFFSLYHTFQGDQDGTGCPPQPSTSTNGDMCKDTPPHRRSASFSCDLTGNNICYNTPNIDFVENFLDYSAETCQKEFTGDQRMRMRCSLMEIRYPLMYSIGCIAPCPGQTAAFTTETSFVLAGELVEFVDNSTGDGTVKWYVNDVDETPTTVSTDFDWTFTSPGTYFICQEKIGTSCLDRVCKEITVTDNICIDPPLNLENGNFESFTNSAPIETTGIAGTNFINFDIYNWNVLKYSPDFYQTDPTDMSYTNFVRLAAFFQSEDSEGIFACYDFEKDKEYLVCLSVKCPDISSPHELQISLGNNFAKATTFVLSQANPDVGTQLVYNEKNSGFPSWTQESFTFTADQDFNHIAFVNRYIENTQDDGYIFIDNILITPVGDETGFTVSPDTDACLGELVNLVATGGTSYSWSPSSSLTCSDCPNPSALPSETTTYTVDITYGESCPITVSRDVTITINCGSCDAIPSFTDTITDCKVKFTGSNTGDPGEFLWNFGDGTVASGPVVEHEYKWDDDFEVCLTIKCSDFAEVTICDSITIGANCDDCTSISGVNSIQCTPDSLNTYMAEVDFIVSAGLEPCTGDGLFIIADDVNVVVNSFEVIPIDASTSQVLGSFELNTTDQAGFEANGTTIHITLCDSLGVMQCFSTSVTGTTCDDCTEVEIPLIANCDPNMSNDSMNFYIDTFTIPNFPTGITSVDITSSITGFNFSHSNGVVIYTINTESDLPLTESILVHYTVPGVGKVCLTYIIQTPEPCFDPLPENCVANWDPKPVDCERSDMEGYAVFDYDMTVNLGPYELCDGELSATLEGGMAIITNSMIVGNQLSFSAQLLVPENFTQSSTSTTGDEYILRIYLCDPLGNIVCYGFPLDLTCNRTKPRSTLSGFLNNGEVNLHMYPNPVRETVNLHVVNPTKESDYKVQLMDMNGSLYHSLSLDHAGKTNIDVSAYPSGVYLVRFIENGIFIEMKKLIIIH